MIQTAHLHDIVQRQEPIETMGVVIGTAGSAAYIHLQLEVLKRMFGKSMPVLVINDGPAKDDLRDVVRQYADFAELRDFPASLGHSVGDIRSFTEGLKWSKDNGIDILVKLSRRFIPLVSWRHSLQVLVSENVNAAVFTRRHNDRPDGLFRTDCIAIRCRTFENARTTGILTETLDRHAVNVEPMFESFAKMNGGWVMWDLLGQSFYKPHSKAMQWRGLLPYHYADLARELGLTYTEPDFDRGSGTYFTEVKVRAINPCSAMEVVEAPLTSST